MIRLGFSAGTRGLAVWRWVPYVLFLTACAVSAYAAYFVALTAESGRRDRFFAAADEIRHRIEVRLDTYVDVVRDGSALLAASNEIHPGEFRAFVRQLELSERYPDLAGIGFAQRVSRQQLPAFVRAMELDGAGPVRPRLAVDRPDHDLIVFFEPTHADRPYAVGADLSTDGTHRAAMDRARDTGEPALAGGSTPAAPADAVTLYVPVYRTGARVATIEQRRRALLGFVFSPVSATALFERAGVVSLDRVTFEVYAGTEASTAALMFASSVPTPDPEYVSSGPLSLGGQTWLLVVKSVDAVPAVLPRQVRNTLIGGLMLSLVLFVILRLQIAAVAGEREARARAQAADRAKDDFLIAASHELRTPISAVLGWVSMLKTGAVHEDRRAHALDVIERNARLQARLIEDLLDVSRIVRGQLSIDLQPLDATAEVSLVLDSLRPAAITAGVELHPLASDGPCAIHGDSARIQQIAWNLVANAIKFTPSGGDVFVGLKDEGEWVQLSVRDTGIGIDPDFIPRVFERFTQADVTSRTRSGLGLGMAITRQLVELHGGVIAVRSDGRGRGTTFLVRIPAARARSDRSAGTGRSTAAQTRTRPRLDIPSARRRGHHDLPPSSPLVH